MPRRPKGGESTNLTLLVGLLWAGALLAHLSRRWTAVHFLLCLGILLAVAYLVAQGAVPEGETFLGLRLALKSLGRLFFWLVLGGAGALVLYGASAAGTETGADNGLASMALVVSGCLVAALLVPRELGLGMLFLAGASFLIACGDWAQGREVKLQYLTAAVVALCCGLGAVVVAQNYELMREPALIGPAAGLLTAGFGIWLGIIPFHAWLPGLLSHARAGWAALVVGPVTGAAVYLLIGTLASYPWLVADPRHRTVAMLGGLATALVAGLLSLGPKEPRRIAAYWIVADAGYLVAGLATASAVGVTGALVMALGQAPAKLLVVLATGLAPGGQAQGTSNQRGGLTRRTPVSAAAFAVGGLSLAGLPPWPGFAGRWLVYQALAAEGSGYALVAIVAAAMAVLSIGRACGRIWDETPAADAGAESLGPALVLAALALFALGLGVYPAPLVKAVAEGIAGLDFLPAG